MSPTSWVYGCRIDVNEHGRWDYEVELVKQTCTDVLVLYHHKASGSRAHVVPIGPKP